jgi:competence protein ComEC
MPTREAELARGFVLGEDDEIDAATAQSFRRAGLSHLLAVSGQNVALLALLAMPVLAALGLGLRERLLWVMALIAAYVPLAGAGPSILRAAVMGALSVFAALAGRRTSRLYALAVAATVTLAVDPGLGADVGWQLSFAAVLGILAVASPLRGWFEGLIGRVGGLGRALAEGAAVTVAATLATAPLIAFHFGEASLVSLAANLLAMPAVAPAMWLGMLIAALGQVPGVPLSPLGAVDAVLLAYVARVAEGGASPGWASVRVGLGGAGLIASYAALAALVALLRLRRRRPPPEVRRRQIPRKAVTALLAGFLGLALTGLSGFSGETVRPARPDGLRVSILDVGQRDAILLQPASAPAVLVDGGPPGDGLVAKLESAGVERIGAAVITHDESDHAAGIEQALGAFPIGVVVHARLGRAARSLIAAAGVPQRRLAAGGEIESGALRLTAIWPPPVLLEQPPRGIDPNDLALVVVARWHRFSMLLCADAEAESVPIDPGPVDVLKVAHHGSEDAGLAALLERTRPRLAVISVGQGNSYGHPTGGTLATLASHGVRTLRTDRDGTVVLEVEGDRITVGSG